MCNLTKGPDAEFRPIRLGPRLKSAYEMLTGFDCVADIGCDHGQLICALLQNGGIQRGIATDVSQPSLEKAAALCERAGVADRLSLRTGDGFSVLVSGEADAAALLGMGGTLMARLLEACDAPFSGAKRIVFQPMRGVADIRGWLYEKGCRILDDRVVREGDKLYQVFAALPPGSGNHPAPAGWPQGYFGLGSLAFANRDPLLLALAEEKLRRARIRLTNAPPTGALAYETDCLQTIVDHFDR